MYFSFKIVSTETSERSYQSSFSYYARIFNNYRISDHLNDHQGNKEELTI